MAATDFEHAFAVEIHLGRRAVVELDENRLGSSEAESGTPSADPPRSRS